jgi:hypothetical protein
MSETCKDVMPSSAPGSLAKSNDHTGEMANGGQRFDILLAGTDTFTPGRTEFVNRSEENWTF